MDTDRIVHPEDPRYETLRSGFNIAVEHRPELIVDAATPADVAGAVALAARRGRAVAVMNTGHGASRAADGAVLVRTGRMRGVEVDPIRRTARIEAGASWGDVLDATTPHGLAPLNGSSPHVGAVGYTVGGGIGLLARRFGFAADHVRWMDVVTADGRLRHVTADASSGSDADPDPDLVADRDTDRGLFWALRGAGANFGVVTAMEVDLFPVASLVGGELCFAADAPSDVLHAYADWVRDVPETMASSVLLLRYPDADGLPPELRGRHVTHVRLAYSGDDQGEGFRLVEPLRRLATPLVDTVRVMPYAEVGTIHHEPTDVPVAAFDRNILLADFDHDAARTLHKLAGPDTDSTCLVELRDWGGALARPPEVPNAIGYRDAAFSLLAISDPDIESRAGRDEILDTMAPWSTGMAFPNFCGVEDTAVEAVRRCYRPGDFTRLQRLKAAYDPGNRFRVNFNIPPRA